MNERYIEKMRKDRSWFLKMSLLFGLCFVFFIYRNMSGITFPILTAALAGFSAFFQHSWHYAPVLRMVTASDTGRRRMGISAVS